jgi:predicted metal-dependent enzyme (double-stranded beta helix superfamily)
VFGVVFDLDEFVVACLAAASSDEPRTAVKEVLDEALASPAALAAALPAQRAELSPIHSSAELTIMKVIWAPGMSIPPHNHHMWAAIGIYGGEEINSFYRRTGSAIEDSGGRHIREGESLLLGEATIHAVTNPVTRSHTGAIHIYGGDFLNVERSLWDPETLVEGPADGALMQKIFEAAND